VGIAVSELDGLKLLRRIEEGVAGKYGESFFKQIVHDLSEALSAYAAFAGRLNADRTGSMLAFWVKDSFQPCLTYPLSGTPCEFVYKGQITAFARDIRNIFPADREWFAQLGVNSYLGIPIKGETGAVVGHLAVMDTCERDWLEADFDVLGLFSMRTAVELERANSHRQLEQSNQALAEANARLMTEIEHRAQVEKELAAATQAAQAANHAKNVFISQMSHELRTPLNGILGYAQLMRRETELPRANRRDGLEVIERSGEHLLTLVNDLLDLAKIDAGKFDLTPTEIDLRQLLTDVGDLIGERARRAQLDFIVAADSAPAPVFIDGRALRQILLNLLGNAVKFTPPGGRVELRVQTLQNLQDRYRIGFQVRDSGVGIPPHELENIFEPFHRVTSAGSVVEGTGLGLTITRRLVAAMGGRLEVESRVGEGSTFEFEVLVRAVARSSTQGSEGDVVRAYDGERKRVLVVDDDPVNRELLRGLLLDLGFLVSVAEDGARALRCIDESAPDLVITDLLMPNVNGADLARALRARSSTQSLPVIALSASAAPAAHRQVTLEGFNAVLTKPVRFGELLECIRRCLELRWIHGLAFDVAETVTLGGADEDLDERFIANLGDLAMRGDVQALKQLCDHAGRSSQKIRLLLAELAPLVSNFDTAAVRRVLASVRAAASSDTAR
jgi:signal transduction histidine kinase/DNA-binding response OmpR family regulator